MQSQSRAGIVLAVCLRSDSGVPKYPQARARIGQDGVEGDFHAGPVNKHKKTGPPEPNHRQLTVVAAEALDSASRRLGVTLGAGAIGENLLVEGLGDLADLRPGDVLRVGAEASMRVTGQNTPCATLSVYHKDIVKALTGIRGVTAVVVTPGVVQPGDAVTFAHHKS